MNSPIEEQSSTITTLEPLPLDQVIKRSPFSRSFQALRIRNYRLYWISQVISLTGSWMQTTAQAWLVLKLTASPFALGLVITFQFTPMLLLTLFGGVIADRLPKRKTLIVTQSLALIQALVFGLLVASGSIQLWHIYLLAMIQGTISAVDDPVRESFVVEMVGRADLANAVALNAMSFNAARTVGPAIAGLLVATIGVSAALYLNAISFLAVIVALLKIDPQALLIVKKQISGSIFQNVRQGASYIRHTTHVLTVFIALSFVGTFGFNFIATLPLLAKYVVKLDDAGFGLLSVFVGAGSVVAGIGIAYYQRVSKRNLILSGMLYSFFLGAAAFTTNIVLAGVLFTMVGMLSVIFSATSSTLLQLAVPDALRGRVMGFSVLFYMGTKPISGFLIGALSDHFGTSIAVFVMAIACLIGVLNAVAYHRFTIANRSHYGVAVAAIESDAT